MEHSLRLRGKTAGNEFKQVTDLRELYHQLLEQLIRSKFFAEKILNQISSVGSSSQGQTSTIKFSADYVFDLNRTIDFTPDFAKLMESHFSAADITDLNQKISKERKAGYIDCFLLGQYFVSSYFLDLPEHARPSRERDFGLFDFFINSEFMTRSSLLLSRDSNQSTLMHLMIEGGDLEGLNRLLQVELPPDS